MTDGQTTTEATTAKYQAGDRVWVFGASLCGRRVTISPATVVEVSHWPGSSGGIYRVRLDARPGGTDVWTGDGMARDAQAALDGLRAAVTAELAEQQKATAWWLGQVFAAVEQAAGHAMAEPSVWQAECARAKAEVAQAEPGRVLRGGLEV